MKYLKLENYHLPAIVDDEDYERCVKYKWYAHEVGKSTKTIYVQRPTYNKITKKKSTQFLHNFILGENINGGGIDHKFSNGLDNRKTEIRFCTQSQNAANQRKKQNCLCLFKGVTKRKNGKYVSQIKFKGIVIHLGTFIYPCEAALVYNKKAIELFGEFSRINFYVYGAI